MQKTAAITGATGFVGSHAVRRLIEAGWRVRLLSRRLPIHPNLPDASLEVVIGDLDDPRALRSLVRDADAVVHVAGLIKGRTRAEIFETNVTGTQRLAEIATSQQTKPRFVLISSIAAREPSLSDYAASKNAGESALAANAADMSWTILRPPAVYGPGDRETLGFFRLVQRGWAVRPKTNGRLSMIHVTDLAEAIVHAAETLELGGAVLELDDGRSGGYSWSDLISSAAGQLGVRPMSFVMPSPLLTFAAGLGSAMSHLSGTPPTLNLQKLRELLHPDWVCHDTRPIAASGWRPSIGIDEGFARTVTWYRQQGWL
ncbi:MAG: NAD-dependent epimerase/dehydratase family protein [Dongiaceae bacterium]